MQCLIDHIVINMKDDDSMIHFYTHVLDLEPERLEEYRSGQVPFPSVRLNAETIIDLFPEKLWKADDEPGTQVHPNLNHFCLCLSQSAWEGLSRRLADNHIVIEEGPVSRWGARGTGISNYFRDPENNMIEARYYENGSDEPCMLGS